jgi:hypothetical protein
LQRQAIPGVRDSQGHKLCVHNKIIGLCKKCGGHLLCQHERRRDRCTECGGSGICQHNKRRGQCLVCGGNQICIHKKVRYSCKKCGGSEICQHSKRRYVCKVCGGSQICNHNINRSRCKECNPAGAYKNYVDGARRRGVEFSLSFEEYREIVKQPCDYCGAHDKTNGMDQVIAGKGYTLINIVSCCEQCNFMKKDYSKEDFINHAKRITEYSAAGPRERH